ncbi:hypothetical protein PRZ48_014844 [Zasmidium cellare]|uniref:Acyltransferase 3 domain-containing protein n=1 Tax=Zasmidium cellare TaxID=395010 RepID=A0ABR0DWV5_ZASCE|nr:hypothetical protein PRZ48_014844 [Zasmidium cellare]
MPELDKDEMEHREDEVFELSPLLEGDARGSDEVREDEALLPSTEQEEQHGNIPPEPSQTEPAPPKQTFAKIEYLDGLRGLAALWVFVQHKMGGGTQEFGFGQNGDQWHFVQLPVVRLFFGTGGNAAVVIFFVLSGYVLSISSFRKLKQDRAPECRRALLSALIRRPLRLYIPPIVLSLIDAFLLHVPGPLVLPLPWDGGRPQEDGLWAEMEFFWEKSVDYFSIFREHGSNLFAYPYNVAMWTVPIELKGSLLVFALVFILSLGIRGPDHQAPLMVALMLFGACAVMLQRMWKWSMTGFMFGMMLALVDTWPIGEAIKSGFTPPQKVRDLGDKLTPKWTKTTPGWVSSARERWTAIRSVKLTPEWLSKRFPKSWKSEQTQTSNLNTHKPTLFAHLCFYIGLYLLSQPSHAGDMNFSANTPGWGWLTTLIPEPYGKDRYYRYWQSWASLLVVYAVLRIPFLQRFFSTRPLKFLGYVSFMLYLIHVPFFRTFPDRVSALLGDSPDPHLEGSFWDGTWTVPKWGLAEIDLRFWVDMAINLPTTLVLAWVFTKILDTPCVKLGKWVTRLIGLDAKKPTKATTEGKAMASTTQNAETLTSALATIFTPPSSCLQRTYTLSPTGLDHTDAPSGAVLSIWKGYTLDCFPTQAVLDDGWVYISPGICPSAYSIASQWMSGAATMATCCPWYMHVSEVHYDCASWPETTSVEVVANGTTVTTEGYAWDTPIVIAWESKDLELFPHHPTETGTWNVAKGIEAPASPTTVPPITVTDNGMFITADVIEGSGGRGLSTGAQAGIGVGVSLFVILAVAAGVLLFWRRRKARKAAAARTSDDDTPAELPGSTTQPKQLEGEAIHEKPAKDLVHEAGGYTLSHELTGTEPDGSFLRAELEGDTQHELASNSKSGLDDVGRRELEGDLSPAVGEKAELEGDLKEPPDYESSRDYTGDVAKTDRS